MNLDIDHANGKKERGDLTVVYDPQSGFYFWRYTRSNSEQDKTSFLTAMEQGREVAYSSPTGLIDFFVNSRLYIGVHDRKVQSIGAAEHAAIEEIRWSCPPF